MLSPFISLASVTLVVFLLGLLVSKKGSKKLKEYSTPVFFFAGVILAFTSVMSVIAAAELSNALEADKRLPDEIAKVSKLPAPSGVAASDWDALKPLLTAYALDSEKIKRQEDCLTDKQLIALTADNNLLNALPSLVASEELTAVRALCRTAYIPHSYQALRSRMMHGLPAPLMMFTWPMLLSSEPKFPSTSQNK